MLLKNASVLLGKELEYIPEINLKISNQRFTRIQKKHTPQRKRRDS